MGKLLRSAGWGAIALVVLLAGCSSQLTAREGIQGEPPRSDPNTAVQCEPISGPLTEESALAAVTAFADAIAQRSQDCVNLLATGWFVESRTKTDGIGQGDWLQADQDGKGGGCGLPVSLLAKHPVSADSNVTNDTSYQRRTECTRFVSPDEPPPPEPKTGRSIRYAIGDLANPSTPGSVLSFEVGIVEDAGDIRIDYVQIRDPAVVG